MFHCPRTICDGLRLSLHPGEPAAEVILFVLFTLLRELGELGSAEDLVRLCNGHARL
jgi:hypothetical protein